MSSHVTGREKTARCAHLLVKHTESRNPVSRRTGEQITMSKDHARRYLEGLLEGIKAAPDSETAFRELCSSRSDCGSYREAGDLGDFGRGQMQRPFEEATFALKIGELSGVVDTDSGLHVILRLPLRSQRESEPPAKKQRASQVRAAHLLLKTTSSRNPVSRRTNEAIRLAPSDARVELEGYRKEILSSEDPHKAFAAKAKQRSDCSSYARGGDLGHFGPGQMQKPFEDASFALEVGASRVPPGLHHPAAGLIRGGRHAFTPHRCYTRRRGSPAPCTWFMPRSVASSTARALCARASADRDRCCRPRTRRVIKVSTPVPNTNLFGVLATSGKRVTLGERGQALA